MIGPLHGRPIEFIEMMMLVVVVGVMVVVVAMVVVVEVLVEVRVVVVMVVVGVIVVVVVVFRTESLDHDRVVVVGAGVVRSEICESHGWLGGGEGFVL